MKRPLKICFVSFRFVSQNIISRWNGKAVWMYEAILCDVVALSYCVSYDGYHNKVYFR